MLSDMETTDATLRAAERAAAAPFIDYPKTPWWYPLLFATFMTAVLAGPALVQHGHGIAGFGLQFLSLAALITFARWYRTRWGAWPRMSAAPAEIKGAYRWFLTMFVVGAVVSVAAWLLGGPQVGLPAIFVVAYALIWAYEGVVYPRAAQRVRERLA